MIYSGIHFKFDKNFENKISHNEHDPIILDLSCIKSLSIVRKFNKNTNKYNYFYCIIYINTCDKSCKYQRYCDCFTEKKISLIFGGYNLKVMLANFYLLNEEGKVLHISNKKFIKKYLPNDIEKSSPLFITYDSILQKEISKKINNDTNIYIVYKINGVKKQYFILYEADGAYIFSKPMTINEVKKEFNKEPFFSIIN